MTIILKISENIHIYGLVIRCFVNRLTRTAICTGTRTIMLCKNERVLRHFLIDPYESANLTFLGTNWSTWILPCKLMGTRSPKSEELCDRGQLTGPLVLTKQRGFSPYINKVTGKLLGRHGVETVFRPTRSIQQHLKSAKDARDPLASSCIYSTPCSCGQVCMARRSAVRDAHRWAQEGL